MSNDRVVSVRRDVDEPVVEIDGEFDPGICLQERAQDAAKVKGNASIILRSDIEMTAALQQKNRAPLRGPTPSP